MTGVDTRGPFLLLFALDQQVGSLLTRAMADAPLRPAEFAVYSTLRTEQPTTPSVLAATLGMPATTLSSQLAKMTTAGHLDRSRNPRDGRSSLLALTPAGLAATEACIPAFERAISAFRRHLSIDEAVLLVTLEEVSAALSASLVADDVGGAADR